MCEGDSSDVGPIFRQESYFHWCFGVLEPDYFGAIDVATGRATIYMPRLPEDYGIIMGHVPTPQEVQERYQVDEVKYVDEMPEHLASISASPSLLLLEGPNTDSGKVTRPAAFDGMAKFNTNRTFLHHQMAEARVKKTPAELEVLRYASKISSLAHMHVMRTIKPGMKEYQAEATFLHHVYFYGGARHVCYNCIAAAGGSGGCWKLRISKTNIHPCFFTGAVLHYGHAGAANNQTVCRLGLSDIFDKL